MAELDAKIQALLDGSGIAYEVMDCDPELADTERFCAHYGESLAHSANAIVVKSKTGEERFVACLVLATCRIDVNHTVRRKLGARKVSFASPEETERLTGMTLGGVTPVALPPELPLWVDARIMELDYVILGAGHRAAKIKLAPAFFRQSPNTEIVEGLAREVS